MNERPAELARSEPHPLDIAPVSRKRRRTPGRRCGHCPATARPLRMFFGLRPVPESFWSSEQLLDPFGSKGGQLPVDIGLPSRATASRLIDQYRQYSPDRRRNPPSQVAHRAYASSSSRSVPRRGSARAERHGEPRSPPFLRQRDASGISEVTHTSVAPTRSAIQSSAASALSPTSIMLTFDMPGGRIGREPLETTKTLSLRRAATR